MNDNYFNEYMEGVFSEYKRKKLFIDIKKKNDLIYKYKTEIEKNMMIWELEEYYSNIIYKDKYGIFDSFIDKEFTVQYIYNLYYDKCQIRFYEIMNIQYSQFIDYWKITEKEKVENLLSFLSKYIKRGILKLRIKDNKNNYVEYNSSNENLLMSDLLVKYLNSEDKYFFLLECIEIILAENEWK